MAVTYTETTNFNLYKPELTAPADITKFNENWDKIDAQLGQPHKVYGTSIDGVTYTATDPTINLEVGTTIIFIPNTKNTSTSVRLNLNGTGAVGVYQSRPTNTATNVSPKAGWLYADRPVMLMYTGSVWKSVSTVEERPHDLWFGENWTTFNTSVTLTVDCAYAYQLRYASSTRIIDTGIFYVPIGLYQRDRFVEKVMDVIVTHPALSNVDVDIKRGGLMVDRIDGSDITAVTYNNDGETIEVSVRKLFKVI